MDHTQASKIFSYDEHTGLLTWKHRTRSEFDSQKGYRIHTSRFANKIAGSESSTSGGKKYVQIHFMNKRYLAHRIIWMIVHKETPDQIDHIDGNGLNNKLSNIRNVTISDNSRNTKKGSANTTGHIGVYRNKSKNRPWRVFIKINGKMIFRGTFETLDEAIVERAIAERQYGFHMNHGA